MSRFLYSLSLLLTATAMLAVVNLGQAQDYGRKGPAGPAPVPDVGDPAPPVGQDKVAVYLHNKSPFKIFAAGTYRTEGQWKTEGFWEIKPGEKIGPLFQTDNKFVYFYANSEDHKVKWDGPGLFRSIEGQRYGFHRTEIKGTPANFTFEFLYRAPDLGQDMAPPEDGSPGNPLPGPKDI